MDENDADCFGLANEKNEKKTPLHGDIFFTFDLNTVLHHAGHNVSIHITAPPA